MSLKRRLRGKRKIEEELESLAKSCFEESSHTGMDASIAVNELRVDPRAPCQSDVKVVSEKVDQGIYIYSPGQPDRNSSTFYFYISNYTTHHNIHLN